MPKKLWDFVDGEPFMVNPRLGIINPRKRRKGRKMAKRRKGRMPPALARYWAKHRRGRKHSPKRRKRRNAWPTAGIAINPRRRRRRTYRMHNRKRRSYRVNRRHRRHHYRRNPSLMGISLPPMSTILYAGAGFAVPPMVEGFLSTSIPSLTTTITGLPFGKYLLKGGVVFGLTFLTRQFIGRAQSNAVLLGGSLYILVTLIKDYAPSYFPGLAGAGIPEGLSTYVPPSMAAYPSKLAALPSAAFFPGPGFMKSGTESGYGTAARFKRF